jgi:hypothetical protein
MQNHGFYVRDVYASIPEECKRDEGKDLALLSCRIYDLVRRKSAGVGIRTAMYPSATLSDNQEADYPANESTLGTSTHLTHPMSAPSYIPIPPQPYVSSFEKTECQIGAEQAGFLTHSEMDGNIQTGQYPNPDTTEYYDGGLQTGQNAASMPDFREWYGN